MPPTNLLTHLELAPQAEMSDCVAETTMELRISILVATVSRMPFRDVVES